MVTCRFSTLCGEHRVSVAEVKRATGVARNSLLALYHDSATRYDRDTLDRLCAYFGIGIGELLVYTPDET